MPGTATQMCRELDMLAGMISWTPDLDTVNGVIAIDGSLVPQFGVLGAAGADLYEKNGVIDHVEGGKIGQQWEKFMRDFDHSSDVYAPPNVCVGFHPNAKLTGQLGEDERIYGGSQWGFGAIGSFLVPPDGVPAPSHLDATCLCVSIYLDGKPITIDGKIVDDDLKNMRKN